MMKKVRAATTVTTVLFFYFSAVAQNIEGVNARLDAMGGSGATDDLGWCITQPIGIFGYANQMQGSLCLSPVPTLGQIYGNVFGVVGLTPNLAASITLNNRLLMPADFYKDASLLLNADFINGDNALRTFPNLPTVYLAYKVNKDLFLGLGGYFEGTSSTKREVKKNTYRLLSDTIYRSVEYKINSEDKSIRNDGLFLEAKATLGPVTIYPQFKLGFPRYGGKETTDELTTLESALKTANADSSFRSDSVKDYTFTYNAPIGRYFKTGSHAWGTIGELFLIGGLFMSEKTYQLKKTIQMNTALLDSKGARTWDSTYNSARTYSHRAWRSIDFWLACVPTYKDGFYFSPEYDGGVIIQTGKDSNYPSDTTFIFWYNNFRIGAEKVTKNLWIFNDVAFRCGLVTYFNKEFRTMKNSDPTTSSTYADPPWDGSFWGSDFRQKEVKITGGLGLKRGRGTFDLSVDFIKWTGMGIFSGPPAGLVSLTVDFGPTK